MNRNIPLKWQGVAHETGILCWVFIRWMRPYLPKLESEKKDMSKKKWGRLRLLNDSTFHAQSLHISPWQCFSPRLQKKETQNKKTRVKNVFLYCIAVRNRPRPLTLSSCQNTHVSVKVQQTYVVMFLPFHLQRYTLRRKTLWAVASCVFHRRGLTAEVRCFQRYEKEKKNREKRWESWWIDKETYL